MGHAISGEEKWIFTKAGENNWSVSDEGKICVSFSIISSQIYFILFQTVFSYFFCLSSFVGCISNWFILPGSSVLLPSSSWLGLWWDKHKTDHRTWMSSPDVMPLTCGIATVSLDWFCLWFWKQCACLGQYCLFDCVHLCLWRCGHLWARCTLLRNQCLKYNCTINLSCAVVQNWDCERWYETIPGVIVLYLSSGWKMRLECQSPWQTETRRAADVKSLLKCRALLGIQDQGSHFKSVQNKN